MKDKEVCQNWIKILRDVFFTIYMYTWSRKPRSILYNKELAKAAFFSLSPPTSLPSLLPPYTKKLAAERKQQSLTTTRH